MTPSQAKKKKLPAVDPFWRALEKNDVDWLQKNGFEFWDGMWIRPGTPRVRVLTGAENANKVNAMTQEEYDEMVARINNA